MSRIVVLLLFCTSPALADIDMLQRLTGVYGDPHPVFESCKGTVQHLNFSNQYQRGAVEVWVDDVGPEPFIALNLNFTVQGTTPQGVEILFDGEEFHTATGAFVVWEFRPLASPERYCWHRTDWPADRCINTVQRCEPEVPIS